MISKEMLDRINELSRKNREEGLDECEKAEQQALRQKYLDAFKQRLKAELDCVVVQEPDGSKHKLQEKN
jgi:uncharacterized protein YnzC (UPF0291/DUF896 family)